MASAAGCLAFGGTVRADSVTDVMYTLAANNGYLGVPAIYDFNDISISSDVTPLTPVLPGDVIEGIFTIGSISLETTGMSFVDSIDLSTRDVEVFGRFTLTIGTVSPTLWTTTVANFEVFEDDRADGVRSVTVPSGLTGSVGYNSTSWGGGAGIGASVQGGSLFASLDILSGGSYSFVPLPNGDLSILPNLDVAGGPVLNPILGVTGRVGGTGTVSATSVPGEFTDRASFSFNATVVPNPTAAAGGLVLAALAYARRRRPA
ncbi:hypothetical protein [Mucisphaera sp.]|uniref:hypothetical protein n=1 Tax=Mucisphaera sp. TaxID=2913024 RepID=UPI003D12C61F